MSGFQIVRGPRVFKWVPLLCPEIKFAPKKFNLYVNGSLHLGQETRLYGTESCAHLRNGVDFGWKGERRAQAQSALLEYFHFTRNLRFMDAENMSKNAPLFFDRLMKSVKVGDNDTIEHSVNRFLRYHPINEFEPFFESIGLNPAEYDQFLPKDFMFLADDELLLENYYVLCNYGIETNRIGRFFKEANEVFRFDYGVLQPKLRSFENLGLRQSIVVKIIASSPRLLSGNGEFVDFLEKLKMVEIDYEWLLNHVSQEDSCDWKCMLHLLCLFFKFGWSEKQVGDMFKQNPCLLCECSGRKTLGLISLLLKFGSTTSDIQTLFLQFPQMRVSEFTYKLHNSYAFLVEAKMAAQDIGCLVRSCPVLLGSIELKKIKTVQNLLNSGKKRICQMVKDNPYILENWAPGRKIDRLESQRKSSKSSEQRDLKTQFLISLGFEENSDDMEKALKLIGAKGADLQERFDSLVKSGVTREEGIAMVKVCPRILNHTGEAIESKIRFFFDDLGYRVSDLLTYPKLVTYTIKRLKLRLLTYKWLKDQRAVRPNLSFSTLLCYSDEEFMTNYVKRHARGPEFWKSLNERLFNQMVKDNPYILENWVLGRKLDRLKSQRKSSKSSEQRDLKTQFLISLGFEENSEDMEKALKLIRAKGMVLQERFDSLVKSGFTREEGIEMVKVCPLILNQTSEVTESKIRFFFDDLGCRVSDLLTYPKLISYTIKRVKLRLLTYQWLKDQRAVRPNLSLSTLLSTSDKQFMKTYVKRHARGPEFWKSLNERLFNQTVKDNPYILENWVLDRKLDRLEYQRKSSSSEQRDLKTQFLISLGFEENSDDMEKALKLIVAEGVDLQERFDSLVKSGVTREEGIAMVKVCPRILNQTSEATESKIRFFLDDLGYRVSDLLTHPTLLCYTIKRLKLRLLTYKWLRDQRAVHPNLSFSTLLCHSDEAFMRNYVKRHARGPEFWKSLNERLFNQMVKDNPYILENWVLDRKLERLESQRKSSKQRDLKTQFPISLGFEENLESQRKKRKSSKQRDLKTQFPISLGFEENLESQRQSSKQRDLRTQFLISLGFEENSDDMERALKLTRAEGVELQKRFDSLVKSGVTREEGIEMVKVCPQILNQTGEVTESKIRFFFDDLGYQVSDLLTCPNLIRYKIKRVKLRLLTYKWLQDQRAVRPNLSFGTIVSTSDKQFMKMYVKPHAGAAEFWKSLNQEHL